MAEYSEKESAGIGKRRPHLPDNVPCDNPQRHSGKGAIKSIEVYRSDPLCRYQMNPPCNRLKPAVNNDSANRQHTAAQDAMPVQGQNRPQQSARQ